MNTMSHDEKISALNEKITNLVIEAIQTGIATGNWSPPWAAGPDIWSPMNPVTGRRYTGGNRANLGMLSWAYGFGSHYATYDQWASLSRHTPACLAARQTTDPRKLRRPSREVCEQHDCELVHVRKGERGHYALRPILRKMRDDDGVERERIVGFQPYTVFVSNQVAGYVEPKPVTIVHDEDTGAQFAEAEAYARTIGVDLRHSDTDGAYYQPALDYITMPALERWQDPEDYWSVLVHEMIHWTGHKDRLARPGIVEVCGQGSETYGREELVAELGAAFHLAHMGRSATVRQDHMEYLAGWLKILSDDPTALWKAATAAEHASTMLGRRFGIATVPDKETTAA